MPIVDLAPRLAELGRIRAGEKKQKPGGKPYPSRLNNWRLTSPQRHLLDQAAALWGGNVQEWKEDSATNPNQWQLTITQDWLPVGVLPHTAATQWYELWAGGGCQRRCDGLRETLTDEPCLCTAAGQVGAERDCAATTRFNVLLPQLSGLGQWRLETHSWYAAQEMAGFLALVQRVEKPYVEATLRIDHRTVKRPGQPTKRFSVPVLDIAQPMGVMLHQLGLTEATPALPAPAAAALPAPTIQPAPTAPPPPDEPPPFDPETGEILEDPESGEPLHQVDHEALHHEIGMLLAEDVDPTATMPTLDDRLRSLYRLMEKAGLWNPNSEGLDALHQALHKHHKADHVADLRKADLVAFSQRTWAAARQAITGGVA